MNTSRGGGATREQLRALRERMVAINRTAERAARGSESVADVFTRQANLARSLKLVAESPLVTETRRWERLTRQLGTLEVVGPAQGNISPGIGNVARASLPPDLLEAMAKVGGVQNPALLQRKLRAALGLSRVSGVSIAELLATPTVAADALERASRIGDSPGGVVAQEAIAEELGSLPQALEQATSDQIATEGYRRGLKLADHRVLLLSQDFLISVIELIAAAIYTIYAARAMAEGDGDTSLLLNLAALYGWADGLRGLDRATDQRNESGG